MYLRLALNFLHFLPYFGCALRPIPNFYEIHPRSQPGWLNKCFLYFLSFQNYGAFHQFAHQFKQSKQYLVVILTNQIGVLFNILKLLSFSPICSCWKLSKQYLVFARAYLAILNAKSYELVLYIVFSYPLEIFSSSTRVTIKT
jgi:hypothetical protein